MSIRLKRAQWDDFEHSCIARVPSTLPNFDTVIRKDVAEGRTKMLRIHDGNVDLGIIAVRGVGDDLYVDAVYCARVKGKSLVHDIFPIIEEFAASLGYQTITFHTVRAGLVNASFEHGYYVREISLRKQLS